MRGLPNSHTTRALARMVKSSAVVWMIPEVSIHSHSTLRSLTVNRDDFEIYPAGYRCTFPRHTLESASTPRSAWVIRLL